MRVAVERVAAPGDVQVVLFVGIQEAVLIQMEVQALGFPTLGHAARADARREEADDHQHYQDRRKSPPHSTLLRASIYIVRRALVHEPCQGRRQ